METILIQKAKETEFSTEQITLFVSTMLDNNHDKRMAVHHQEDRMTMTRYLAEKIPEWINMVLRFLTPVA
jgi:hypothetical protein